MQTPHLFLNPHGRPKMLWDLLGVVSVLYSTTTVPIWVAFAIEHTAAEAIWHAAAHEIACRGAMI